MRSGLIFSNTRPARFGRHLAFWCVLAIFFYVQSLMPAPDPYYSALMSLFCFFPTCIVASYVLLYFFLPAYLEKKKYLQFAAGLVALILISLTLNCYASALFLQLTCNCNAAELPVYQKAGLGFVNTTHVLTIGGLVLGIKIGKNWHLKRNENLALSKQKVDNDLQLQKSRILPGLLFNSLTTLHKRILAASGDSPEILLKLSDLLSYTLYEGNESQILLEREVAMIENLIDLERMNHNETLNITMNITGNPAAKYISPLILFSLLQQCLETSANVPEASYAIEVIVVDNRNELHLRITATGLADHSALNLCWRNIASDTRKRLIMISGNRPHLDFTATVLLSEINLRLPLTNVAEMTVMNDVDREAGTMKTSV